MKRTFQVKEAGSVIDVIDCGRPFIVMNTEKDVNIGLPGRPHYCPMLSFNDVIDAVVPYGANKDKNFIRNVESAKSIKEVQDICESWVNV